MVILAGGLATRLGEASARRPKVLQTIAGRPFLDHLLHCLTSYGFARFHLALGHLADQVVDHVRLGDGAAEVTFSIERERLGTGGALLDAYRHLDEKFLLVQGDTYIDMDYRDFLSVLDDDALGAMAVTDADCDVTPNVAVSGGSVIRYEKAGVPDGWVDTGVALLRRDALDLVADQARPIDLGAIFRTLIRRRSLRAWRTHAEFFDIGTPARLDRFVAHVRAH